VLPLGAQEGPSPGWKNNNLRDDNRYEGVAFDRNVSPVQPSLISFLATADPDSARAVDVGRDETLQIDFLSESSRPYVVIARELDLVAFYWMEPRSRGTATPGFNVFQNVWKTNVLRALKDNPKTRVPFQNVGAVVWFTGANDPNVTIAEVAPGVIRSERSAPTRRIVSYEAWFLPDVLIDSVTFQVRSGCALAGGSRVFDEGEILTQYPKISFPIAFKLPEDYRGPVLFEITFKADVPVRPGRYCFWHSSNFQMPGIPR
jgi:hypothetical protein